MSKEYTQWNSAGKKYVEPKKKKASKVDSTVRKSSAKPSSGKSTYKGGLTGKIRSRKQEISDI